MTVLVNKISKKYKIFQNRNRNLTLYEKVKKVIKYKDFSGIEEFYALKDISFKVERGESIGIIGRNGSGKSTLLKILAKITPPSNGNVEIHGRIASLLEVGAGFHSELTGRENIFLSGAILGMKKFEIEQNIDSIIEFSEIGKFADTPVKHYSSGMFVRLAFSVASHLKYDILLIDEVLAVGDINFQKKCLDRMDEIINRKGKTIFFVSHNPIMVRNICKRSILLNNGRIEYIGDTESALARYFSLKEARNNLVYLNNDKHYLSNDFKILSLELVNCEKQNFVIRWNNDIKIKINFDSEIDIDNISFGIVFSTVSGEPVFTVRSDDGCMVKRHNKWVIVNIKNLLRVGRYAIKLGVIGNNITYYYNPFVAYIDVVNYGNNRYKTNNHGIIDCEANWEVN